MVFLSLPVLRQFLLTCPGERGRLWEVEPPGAWGQRVNIWLKVYLQERRLQDGEWDRYLLRGLVTLVSIAAPNEDSFTSIELSLIHVDVTALECSRTEEEVRPDWGICSLSISPL